MGFEEKTKSLGVLAFREFENPSFGEKSLSWT